MSTDTFDINEDIKALHDLIADVNMSEILDQIKRDTLSRWLFTWQECALARIKDIEKQAQSKHL